MVRRFLERSRVEARRRSAERAEHLRALIPALAQLLRSLGAERVWVFGSLVWGGVDSRSDLDLAVCGMPRGRLIEAHAALWQRAGEPVDLVELETCSPELRERILASAEELTSP